MGDFRIVTSISSNFGWDPCVASYNQSLSGPTAGWRSLRPKQKVSWLSWHWGSSPIRGCLIFLPFVPQFPHMGVCETSQTIHNQEDFDLSWNNTRYLKNKERNRMVKQRGPDRYKVNKGSQALTPGDRRQSPKTNWNLEWLLQLITSKSLQPQGQIAID